MSFSKFKDLQGVLWVTHTHHFFESLLHNTLGVSDSTMMNVETKLVTSVTDDPFQT